MYDTKAFANTSFCCFGHTFIIFCSSHMEKVNGEQASVKVKAWELGKRFNSFLLFLYDLDKLALK